MEIFCMQTGAIDVNTYILSVNGEAVVIDPGNEEPVLDYLRGRELKPSFVFLTHGHFDHIGGVASLQKEGAKVYIHWCDSKMLEDAAKNLSIFAGVAIKPSVADGMLGDEDQFEVLGTQMRVLHTPGHSPGSVCYYFLSEGVLFSGDTLFRLSAGRVDLPGADAGALYRSISEKLFCMPDETKVYPGHMRPTTIGIERQHNPFMAYCRKKQ